MTTDEPVPPVYKAPDKTMDAEKNEIKKQKSYTWIIIGLFILGAFYFAWFGSLLSVVLVMVARIIQAAKSNEYF